MRCWEENAEHDECVPRICFVLLSSLRERERGVEEEMEEVRVSFIVWINLGESSLSFLFITSSCLTLSLSL